MKRFLPFLIIAVVAVVTVVGATLFYRAKMQPIKPRTVQAPPAVASATPASATTAENSATPAGATTAESSAVPGPVGPLAEDKSLHIRGPLNAPVTMEVYGDFQCPSCGFASVAIRELEEKYSKELRVIFYEFPLAMHNHAVDAARAAEAAALQGKFWEMHDQLYQYQSVWSKVSDPGFFFDNYAEAIGIDVARFRADRQSEDVQRTVIAQGESGEARGVQNTPTIFINGEQVRGGFTRDKLQELIDAALAAKTKP